MTIWMIVWTRLVKSFSNLWCLVSDMVSKNKISLGLTFHSNTSPPKRQNIPKRLKTSLSPPATTVCSWWRCTAWWAVWPFWSWGTASAAWWTSGPGTSSSGQTGHASHWSRYVQILASHWWTIDYAGAKVNAITTQHQHFFKKCYGMVQRRNLLWDT